MREVPADLGVRLSWVALGAARGSVSAPATRGTVEGQQVDDTGVGWATAYTLGVQDERQKTGFEQPFRRTHGVSTS